MTGAALFFLSYAGWFLFLAGATPWPAATLPLFITSVTIAVLYAFSLAGHLLPGAYFMAAAGLALGITGAFRARAKPGDYFSRLLEPGPALFFLLAILLWPILSGTHYDTWDEFSHWGFAAKEIFLKNALPAPDSALYFKNYPPGTALFQYYVTFFTAWSEGSTIFAQVILLLSAAVALLQDIAWKQAARLAVIISLSYLLCVMFGYKPQSLYVDHVLGFLFGASIASCLLSDSGDYRTLLRLLPTLLILPLIKAAGLLLALIAAAAITANHFIAAGLHGNRKKLLGSSLLCAALLLSPVISGKSWGWHLTNLGITNTFTPKVTLTDIKKSFSSSASTRDMVTILGFARALVCRQVGRTIPALFIILLLTLAGLAALRKENRARENLQIRAILLLLHAGFAIYASGLLILYLFVFSSYEGPRLASFGRYIGVFFLAWSFVTMAFFLRLPLPPAPSRFGRYAGRLIILAALISLGSVAFKKVNTEDTLLHKEIREKAAYAVSKTPPGSTIYIIWQGSTGFEPWVMAYELAPRITSTRGGGWSLGKPYNPYDVWTVDVTAGGWQRILKDYDFVMLGKADELFWGRFGRIFENPEKARAGYLFKVTNKTGKLKLLSAAPVP